MSNEVLKTETPRYPNNCAICGVFVDEGPYIYVPGAKGIWHPDCYYSGVAKPHSNKRAPQGVLNMDDVGPCLEDLCHSIGKCQETCDKVLSLVDMIYKQTPPKVV
jgi:hypothetical protein